MPRGLKKLTEEQEEKLLRVIETRQNYLRFAEEKKKRYEELERQLRFDRDSLTGFMHLAVRNAVAAGIPVARIASQGWGTKDRGKIYEIIEVDRRKTADGEV